MRQKTVPQPAPRPFPWPCPSCLTLTVVPATVEYTAEVKHDGKIHVIYLPALRLPRCETCGRLIFTEDADEQINDALRKQLRLLTPAQIRQARKELGLSQEKLAEQVGVAKETISRWETGALIQSRLADNALRVFFAFPQVRAALVGEGQDADLGTILNP